MSEIMKKSDLKFENESNFTIDNATPDDVEAIERMRYKSWLDTYPNEEFGITKEEIDERFAHKLSNEGQKETRKRYEQNQDNPDILQLVAKDGDELVGSIIATKDGDGNEIKMLYTDKKVHGAGVGRALMGCAMEWIGGDQDAFLNVASYNERAKAFYRKFGFTEVGEVFFSDNEPIPQQRMDRRVPQ